MFRINIVLGFLHYHNLFRGSNYVIYIKESRRNLSLMLLAGMITNLEHIKYFVRDTEVVIMFLNLPEGSAP